MASGQPCNVILPQFSASIHSYSSTSMSSSLTILVSSARPGPFISSSLSLHQDSPPALPLRHKLALLERIFSASLLGASEFFWAHIPSKEMPVGKPLNCSPLFSPLVLDSGSEPADISLCCSILHSVLAVWLGYPRYSF